MSCFLRVSFIYIYIYILQVFASENLIERVFYATKTDIGFSVTVIVYIIVHISLQAIRHKRKQRSDNGRKGPI